MMAQLFRVESSDITDLNDLQLTKLLDLLLRLEARSCGITERAVDVALNIQVGDGGEDGRIQWLGGPESTNFIPKRFTQFQNKATSMGPAACANELVTSNGQVKQMVDQALSNDAAYVLFTTQQKNQRQKSASVDAMRAKLESLGKAYALSADIHVYDASVIAAWVNQYIPAIVAVHNWVGRPLERGLKTWINWGQHPDYESFSFVVDPERRAALSVLRELVSQKRKCARCVGLSGLGKTRLAYEIFRDHTAIDDLSKRVVYVDASANASITGLVTDWIQCGLEGIVVVDNCDVTLHDRLRREIQRLDSKLSLLTLDYNFEKADGTEVIHLKPMADEFIKEMLHPVYGEKIFDLDRIVHFAEGFPQMAVLLAASRLDNEMEMGRLNDDSLARKLLWGGEKSNEVAEKILSACALFDKFGLEDEASAEYKFIAEKIIGIDLDDFYKCVKHFEQRGLIDRRGRYARVVPKPLAIRLAAEWWKTTRPERQSDLIQSDMPDALVVSFCDQVSRLDFLPEVKTLVTELCGPQGPFGQAEVILSDKGSHLFRAFVNVNPEVTSSALAELLKQMSNDEIFSISGGARRNLVFALERLCFLKNCFNESAWSMLQLATAENESWSNNATGQFKQLFRTFLSGTEADPCQRLSVIDRALANPIHQLLAVMALEEAITTRNGSRIVGAEYQGFGEPLREWKPSIWQEAFDYWSECLQRLVRVIESKGESAPNAKLAIARSLRGLMAYGRLDDLDRVITQVVDIDGPLWPEAVDSVKSTIRYDSKNMPEKGRKKLEQWLELLTPQSTAERLTLLVTNPPYEHKQNEQGEFLDVATANAESLAKELSIDLNALVPYVGQLQTGSQRLAYFFAKCLVQFSGTCEPLLIAAIKVTATKENANPSFMLGLLDGLAVVNPVGWLEFVNQIDAQSHLATHFAAILTTGKSEEKHLLTLVDFVEKKVLDTSSVASLSYGGALNHVPVNVIGNFVLRLSMVSSEAGWQGLEILSMYCHSSVERKDKAKHAFKDLIKKLPLENLQAAPKLAMYHWSEEAKYILEDESEIAFSRELSKHIVSQNFDCVDYSDRTFYVGPVLRKLLTNYAESVWPVFAEAIKNANVVQKYLLSNLLVGHKSLNEGTASVLADLPDQIFEDWCASEPEIAPEFLAGATDVLAETDGVASISLRARFLIDHYGENERVLSALSANLGTFGWTGSLVPYYARELMVLEPLSDHPKLEVQAWANKRIQYLKKMIEREKRNDQEGEWGLY